MRCLLNATGSIKEKTALTHNLPSPLLSVIDKPILVHILEFLVSEGVKKCDIILHKYPELIEKELGNGKRWGMEITYHLAKSQEDPFSTLRPTFGQWAEESVLYGRGDELPSFSLAGAQKLAQDGSCALFYYPSKEWSGWALLPASVLAREAFSAEEGGGKQMLKTRKHRAFSVHHHLSVRTLQEFQQANFKMIRHREHREKFPTSARMIDPLVWVSRGARIHPTSLLKAPVFIGENCEIKERAEIGPDVVIESNCIVDADTKVKDSVIRRNTYVGEMLEVESSVVDGNLLLHLELHTELDLVDDFILSDLRSVQGPRAFLHVAERGVAAILLCLFSPLLFFMRLFGPFRKTSFVLLPTKEGKIHWKEGVKLSYGEKRSLLSFLPSLVNVVRGELHFVGVPPKGVEEIERMPEELRELYLLSKAGIATLSDTLPKDKDNPELSAIHDAFYSMHHSFWGDCKIFWHFLWSRRK